MNTLIKLKKQKFFELLLLRICPFLLFGSLFLIYFLIRDFSMGGLIVLPIIFASGLGTLSLFLGDGARIKNEIEENKRQINEKINSFFLIK